MDPTTLKSIFGVEFRLSGDNLKARCPFHDDATPSFYVHQDDFLAHCFGCGISGYIDVLVARYKGVSKEKARDLLGIDLNAIIEGRKRSHSRGEEGFQPHYFPKSWLSAWPKAVHQYTLDRGFDLTTLTLAQTRYDSTLARQVFPHYDAIGNLLGVAGRSVKGHDPKWLFYWEYEKSRDLYFIPGENRDRDTIVVVEGVFDVLWLDQLGLMGKCAIMGSHASKTQIQRLRQYQNIIVCLDNDKAGREGTELLRRELRTSNVYFYNMPEYANDVMDLKEWDLSQYKNNLQRKLDVPGTTLHPTETSSGVPS